MRIIFTAICVLATTGSTDAKIVWHDRPVKIEAGSYLIDSITANTGNMVAQTRIAVPAKKKAEWGMCWGDPYGDFTAVRLSMPALSSDYDIYASESARLLIERHNGYSVQVVDEITLGDAADTEGRSNSIKLHYDGTSDLRVYIGTDTRNAAAKVAVDPPCMIWYFTDSEAWLAGCGSVAFDKADKEMPVKTSPYHDIDTLISHIRHTSDAHEGIWRYLDRDTEEKYAAIGGRYTIATVANGKGGYDILYLSGAEINADLWVPLSIKGVITPTIFKDNYDMKWIDAEGMIYDDDTNAQYSHDNAVLTLRFPALDSQLRFSRLLIGQ